MTYWLLARKERLGPFDAAELVWKLEGDLMHLVYRGEAIGDRRGWKLARHYPELVELAQLLPDRPPA